jgi:8-oxo-dGTP diphosphatase
MQVHVAIGVISNARGEILVAKRPSDKSQSGLWEFPGGKVEKNETAFQALKRELLEEIGIQVMTATPWLQINHTYPHRTVLLDTWHVTQFSGEPFGQEGQLIQWIQPNDFSQLPFLEGNREIIEKIRAIQKY